MGLPSPGWLPARGFASLLQNEDRGGRDYSRDIALSEVDMRRNLYFSESVEPRKNDDIFLNVHIRELRHVSTAADAQDQT
jgi:hypothetical protein